MPPTSPAESPPIALEPVTLRAADGHVLGAMHHQPPPGTKTRAALVVAGATAVPQGFYRRFAEHAARRGHPVMTLDYRGIGRSAPPSLRGYRVNYLDWARQDLAAAVEAMHQPGRPLYVVGHSYGGHALGLLPDHGRVHGAWTFATGAGWHGWMPPRERWRVLLLWRLVGPALSLPLGYMPMRRLGLGEDLPLDVFHQWRHWCRFPRYFFDDPALRPLTARFDEVRFPIMAANALDDAWAPPASRDAFMSGYRNAPVQTLTLDPSQTGFGPIGHMGYFRPQARALWDQALDWFDALPTSPSSTISPTPQSAAPPNAATIDARDRGVGGHAKAGRSC